MGQGEPVSVFRPQDQWQGELIVQTLRDYGIDAYLANRASVSLWGNGSMPFVKLEILVPQELAEKASSLIGEFIDGRPEDGDTAGER